MLNIYPRPLRFRDPPLERKYLNLTGPVAKLAALTKVAPPWQTPVPSAQECTVTRRHGNLRRYFVRHYFYLPYVNCGARPAGPAAVSAFRRPAIFGGLPARSAWPALNKSGSGLCEAAQSAIVVEGPIRHLQQRLLPALRLSVWKRSKMSELKRFFFR